MPDAKYMDRFKNHFATLIRAFANRDAVLVECLDHRTNPPRQAAVIMATAPQADGSVELVPLAEMLPGNPYQYLEPQKQEREKAVHIVSGSSPEARAVLRAASERGLVTNLRDRLKPKR